MNEEDARKEMLRRCDRRIAEQMRALLAITFGLFSILALLKGRAYIACSIISSVSTFGLTLVYCVLTILGTYFYWRHSYYVKVARRLEDNIIVKGKEDKSLGKFWRDLEREELETAIEKSKIISLFAWICDIGDKLYANTRTYVALPTLSLLVLAATLLLSP